MNAAPLKQLRVEWKSGGAVRVGRTILEPLSGARRVSRAAAAWFEHRLVKPDAAARVPGTYRTSFSVHDGGARLLREARECNAGERLPLMTIAPLAAMATEELVLPRFDSPGSPWHGTDAVDLKTIEGRHLEFIGSYDDPGELLPDRRPELPLEAFIVRDEALVYRGALGIEGATALDATRTRVVYRLPDSLPPGTYRLVARTPVASRFFMTTPGVKHQCDAPDGAASAWIRILVRA